MLGRARAPAARQAARRATNGPVQGTSIARRLRAGVIRPRAASDLAASAASASTASGAFAAWAGASAAGGAAAAGVGEQQQQQQQQQEQRRRQQRQQQPEHQRQPQQVPALAAAAATRAARAAAAALAAAAPAAAALLTLAARGAWARRGGLEDFLFGRPLQLQPGQGGHLGAGAQRLAMSAALVAVVAAAGGGGAASAPHSLLPTLPGNGFDDLFTNRVFLAGYWAWFAAQLLKIFTKRARKGVWDVRAIVDSGGMPSSHSALCAGVTTALAMQQGLGSSAFAMGVAFTAVVMYDAAGVRRHAGRQAEVLNAVVGELLDDGHPFGAVKLKEVLGHTPLQVVAGAVLGVLVGIFFPAI